MNHRQLLGELGTGEDEFCIQDETKDSGFKNKQDESKQ